MAIRSYGVLATPRHGVRLLLRCEETFSRNLRLCTAVAVACTVMAPELLVGQAAPAVSESRLVLQATGDRGSVDLQGRGLDAFTDARIVALDGRTRPQGITAALGALRGDTRPLSLSIDPGASPGDFAVALVTSRGDVVRIDLTLTVKDADASPVVLDVTAPQSAVAGQGFGIGVSARDDKGLAELRVEWDGGSSGAQLQGETDGSGDLTIEGLPVGSQSLRVMAVDGAGNVSDPITVTVLEGSLGS